MMLLFFIIIASGGVLKVELAWQAGMFRPWKIRSSRNMGEG